MFIGLKADKTGDRSSFVAYLSHEFFFQLLIVLYADFGRVNIEQVMDFRNINKVKEFQREEYSDLAGEVRGVS